VKAKQVVDAIYEELKDKTGLFPRDLEEVARKHAAAAKLSVVTALFPPDKPGRPIEGYLDDFGPILFKIPEVGRVAPPTETATGWDVILLANLIPAETKTHEQLSAELFPEVRRQYFNTWVNQIIKSSGVRITVDQKVVARLEQ